MGIDKRVQNQPSFRYRDSEGRSKIELLVEFYVHSVIKLRHTPSRRRVSGNLIMASRPMKLRGTTTWILSEDSYYVVSSPHRGFRSWRFSFTPCRLGYPRT